MLSTLAFTREGGLVLTIQHKTQQKSAHDKSETELQLSPPFVLWKVKKCYSCTFVAVHIVYTTYLSMLIRKAPTPRAPAIKMGVPIRNQSNVGMNPTYSCYLRDFFLVGLLTSSAHDARFLKAPVRGTLFYSKSRVPNGPFLFYLLLCL